MSARILTNYRPGGGIHPETATLANALAYQSATAPHTGKPWSEEMLFGIGGGIGIGYILWEFKSQAHAILTMGFQHRWNYPREFVGALLDRIDARHRFLETGGAKTAQANLETVLAEGYPAICWVDQALLPYLHVPADYHGCFGWIVTIYGIDAIARVVLVDDLSKKPFLISIDQLTKARTKIGSYKSRILTVDAPRNVRLEPAVRAGIQDCTSQLLSGSDTFGLDALAKWARLITDKKDKKGWPVVFPDGKGLYGALVSLHDAICHQGTDGSGLRGMYADFLSEAAKAFEDQNLAALARKYRSVAKRWSRLAETALSPETFAETHDLIEKKNVILRTKGQEGVARLQTYSARLEALRVRHNDQCPLDAKKRGALLESLRGQLEEIYEAEKNAARSLAEWL